MVDVWQKAQVHGGTVQNIMRWLMCGRKLKYMAARRRFKEALRPYDVKDVIGTTQHISTKTHIDTYVNHISGSFL
jgi:hypothetical protein